MPSPLTHGVIAYTVYRVADRRRRDEEPGTGLLLGVALGVSLIPDVDAGIGLLAGNIGAYHNQMANSVFVGLAVAALVGALVARWTRSSFGPWFLLALACYELHILADFLTWGRGLKLFWPFTGERFTPPFYAFYGVHWSEGIVSIRHLWTLLTELAFGVVLMSGLWLWFRRGRGAAAEGQRSLPPTQV